MKILHPKFTQLLESEGLSLAWFMYLPTLRETNVLQMKKKRIYLQYWPKLRKKEIPALPWPPQFTEKYKGQKIRYVHLAVDSVVGPGRWLWMRKQSFQGRLLSLNTVFFLKRSGWKRIFKSNSYSVRLTLAWMAANDWVFPPFLSLLWLRYGGFFFFLLLLFSVF